MTQSSHHKQRGVALLIVMMALAIMTVLCVEMFYSSRVDVRIGRNGRDRLQAHYLAKSAAKFSILRLYIYREARNLLDGQNAKAMGAAVDAMKTQADQLWSAPFPELPLDITNSDWPGKFSATIQSEGSKIPINLIDGNKHRLSSDEIAKTVKKQLLDLIESYKKDEEWEKLYADVSSEYLVNALVDWIDPDNNAQGGGDEKSEYEKLDPPYGPRNDRIPTLGDLHMIRGWTDQFVDKIKNQISIINDRVAINPNYISLERLKSFDKHLENEDLAQIDKRRRESPFASATEMQNFIRSEVKNGRDFSFPADVMSKSAMRETSFVVEAAGVVGEARKTLKLSVKIPEELPTPTPSPDPGMPPPSPTPSASSLPKLKEPVILRVEEIL